VKKSYGYHPVTFADSKKSSDGKHLIPVDTVLTSPHDICTHESIDYIFVLKKQSQSQFSKSNNTMKPIHEQIEEMENMNLKDLLHHLESKRKRKKQKEDYRHQETKDKQKDIEEYEEEEEEEEEGEDMQDEGDKDKDAGEEGVAKEQSEDNGVVYFGDKKPKYYSKKISLDTKAELVITNTKVEHFFIRNNQFVTQASDHFGVSTELHL